MKSIINWFEIPVTDMERAIAFYEPVMGLSLRREKMDFADLAVFPYDDPATGDALAKFDGIAPSLQGAIIYLHTDDLSATLDRVASAGGNCVLVRSISVKGLVPSRCLPTAKAIVWVYINRLNHREQL